MAFLHVHGKHLAKNDHNVQLPKLLGGVHSDINILQGYDVW